MGRSSYSFRQTVEECDSISTKFLNGHNYFDDGVRRGAMSWNLNDTEIGSIGFEISTIEGDEYIRFQYILTEDTGKNIEFDYWVRLAWTPCNFGGRRWWFICPLLVDGRECGRRVGSLYLGSGTFGCRHCYDLTYESSKESHKYDGLFRAMGTTPKQANEFLRKARGF